MIRAYWRWKYPDCTVEALFREFGMKDQYLMAKRNRFLDDQVRPNQILATQSLKYLKIH
jgi:hypothetical protein